MASECLQFTSCFEIVQNLVKCTLVIWLDLVISQNLEVLGIFCKVLFLLMVSFFCIVLQRHFLLPLLFTIFEQFVGNTF